MFLILYLVKTTKMDSNYIFNTGETQEELKNTYNPEGSTLRKVQKRMLDMLIYLDKVCKKLNIPYSIDGGNLLGAVRHGGFIPWDDDVDVIIERKYFKSLNRYFETHPHPQFVIQNHRTDPGYLGCWSVLRDTKSEYNKEDAIHQLRKYKGLQVDIFPLDRGVTPKTHKFCAQLHRNLIVKMINKKHVIIAKMGYFLLYKILFPLVLFFSKLFGNKNYAMYPIGTTWNWRYNMRIFNPMSTIEFEGHTFSCINNVEEYLIEHYGDYMKLPPKDKRNQHNAEYKIWE